MEVNDDTYNTLRKSGLNDNGAKIFLAKIQAMKENKCKLLDCEVIKNNIELRRENIRLKHIEQNIKEFKDLLLKELDRDFITEEYRQAIEAHFNEFLK